MKLLDFDKNNIFLFLQSNQHHLSMKTIATFLISILLATNVFSQSPKQHILDRTSIGFGMRQSVSLGNHIYSIGENANINQNYPSIVKQDLELNTVWFDHPIRPGATTKYITQLIASSDNNLIMAGSADDNLWLIKMDTLENIIWEKELTTNGDQYPNSFISNNNGGGVLFATEYNSTDYKIQVVNFDINGDTLWTSKLGSASGAFYRNPIGVWDSNNDLIIVLRNGSNSEVVKLNGNDGTLLSHYKLQESIGADCWIKSIYNDGQFTYMAGLFLGGSYTSIVIKMDANGNIVWANKYPEIQHFFAMHKDSNGDLLLQGSINWGENLNLVQILKIDQNGLPLKAKAYGKKPASHLMISNFIEVNDHYIISGWRDYQSAKTAYQISIDSTLFSGSCYERDITVNLTNDNASIVNINSVTQSSLLPDITFFGTPTNTSYLTGGTFVDYDMNNFIQTNFDIIGDDCGGSCNGIIEANATGGDPGYNFEWDNGQTGSIATGLCSNSDVILRTGDQLGCYVYDTINVPQIAYVSDICMVTVDSTSTKNEIVWDKPVSGAIEGFGVYREVVGNYNLVGYVDYDSLSRFVDNTNGVNPNITSYRYKISTFDTCGNESALSDYHETIHLTVNQGAGTNMNLIWDGYEGLSFSYNRILRDSTGTDDWEVVDSVSSSVFTWTDIDAPTVPSRYIIEIITPNSCLAAKAISYGSTRSNKQSISGGGTPQSIGENSDLSAIKVYPNPTKGDFWLEMNSDHAQFVSVELIDVTGKIVLKKTMEIQGESKYLLEMNNLDPAVYLLKISSDHSVTAKTIIKN